VNLQQTPYFTSNIIVLNQPAQRDYAPLDSFVAFMCVQGGCTITALDCDNPDKEVALRTGEAVLIPAVLNDILLTPDKQCRLIETYVDLSVH
jgi:mannose-6-phosphate isomerase